MNNGPGYSTGFKRPEMKLTITDVVDAVLKKQTFGIDSYNPKAMVKDLLPVKTHVRGK